MNLVAWDFIQQEKVGQAQVVNCVGFLIKMKKVKKEQKKPNYIDDFLNQNFHYYGVDVDFKRTQCGGSSCDKCDGYSRCSRIISTQVESVDLVSIMNSYVNETKLSEIETYCLDRILRIEKLYDKDSFEVNTCSGYYGDEVESVHIVSDVKQAIKNKLNEISNLSDVEKIKKVLEYEYGYLLDSIKDATLVEIKEVPFDSIKVGNESYHSKIKDFEMYKDYEGPIAICSSVNNSILRKYPSLVNFNKKIIESHDCCSIIDGYHRYSAAKLNKKDVVKIIVLE